jgi:LysR family transcriptional activator of nhaA
LGAAINRLNFSHLYYFFIVANEGSIKGAAEKLHVSQPTVSDQLKLLEEYFGCLLFERRNRALFITKEGSVALEFAQGIFDQAKELTFKLRNKTLLPKKSLDIGMTHFMAQYFLYDKILPFFNQKEVAINVHENKRHLLFAELEEGNIDMIFTDSRDNLSSTMKAYRVGANRTFVVAHKKYSKSKKNFPNSLTTIPYFGYTDQSVLKYEIELFFSQNDLSPQVIGQADDIDLFEVVTKNGLAFTIVPEVGKNRLCREKDVIVLGELKELQTAVWGIVKKNYEGAGLSLLKENF